MNGDRKKKVGKVLPEIDLDMDSALKIALNKKPKKTEKRKKKNRN